MDRSDIIRKCVDEIKALSDADQLDDNLIEAAVMVAIADAQELVRRQYLDDLGKAFKERAQEQKVAGE